MPGGLVSDQPEGITVSDNGDGSQTVHVTAVLQATVTTGNDDERDA